MYFVIIALITTLLVVQAFQIHHHHKLTNNIIHNHNYDFNHNYDKLQPQYVVVLMHLRKQQIRFTTNRLYLKRSNPFVELNYRTSDAMTSTSDRIQVPNKSHATTTTTTTTHATTSTKSTNNKTISSIDTNQIQWKIRPCENPTLIQMIQWYISGISMYLQQQRIFQNDSSDIPCLVPQVQMQSSNENNKNNMIVLFAFYHQQVIGRFGFVPIPGSISPTPLLNAVQRIYHYDFNDRKTMVEFIPAGAIIYMYIEPKYRGYNIGSIALQIIHSIQASYHCDYNILVANDKSSNSNSHSHDNNNNNIDDDGNGNRKLVQWYLRNGYSIAPELQDMLGSPNGIYGIAMIAPTTKKTISDTTNLTSNTNSNNNYIYDYNMKNITFDMNISNIQIQWW
jgi:GNAT superfamily N-acetyltransferase